MSLPVMKDRSDPWCRVWSPGEECGVVGLVVVVAATAAQRDLVNVRA